MATSYEVSFDITKTETPGEVIPAYIRRIESDIRYLENDLLVTQQQLVAAKAALKALEAI